MTTPEDLLDRAAILRTLRRYSQGVDQRQWDLYLSSFTDEGTVEIPGYLEKRISAKEFVTFLSGTFDRNRLSGQHVLGNTLFDLRGDRARTVTEFLAYTTEQQDEDVAVQRSAGLYVDDLVRAEGGWLIAHRTLVRKSDNRKVVHYDQRTAALTRNAARNPAVAGL
ncbi:hypothetical protein GCM10022223_32400 [Kineosporia mesophila]|uniref:SnoaL-like domain-containing protein n=1 Tax=Kineosporia mesophila TaxID=566012 RepID=A0ABP6ZNW7_9ACTN|nr:nuclear transport factor 2 family protein [Kineosporia mesophila]MCD5354434.1 nuclear transport factor 2 family protein [Kineosporia mesophila]